MSNMIDALLQELEQENAATEKCLNAVPVDKLAWKPHEKSMSLGQLAYHIAANAGGIAEMVQPLETGMPKFGFPEPATKQEVLDVFKDSYTKAKELLNGKDDAFALATWSIVENGNTMFSMPRVAALRMIMLNHLYHHRGQLTVYLRMLNIPVPSVYGPSADDNPFE